MKIYYFSGTGNARNVATWISEYANQQNVFAETIDISRLRNKNLHPSEGDLIGFVSPTHGFNFPPIMIKFLLRFPRAEKNNRVFIINTRAGMKLSKLFLPGLTGIAQLLAAFILLVKGYRIVGMRPIDLPSNWISLHPGIKENVVESIHVHCKKKSIDFIAEILKGKKVYRSLYDLIQDLLISPISLGYYFIGRFIIPKHFMLLAIAIIVACALVNAPLKPFDG